MVSLTAAALLSATLAASPGDEVLLDFTASWCGPCKQMEPTVKRLAAAGYPVRKIDVDRHGQLARKFKVTSVPCFVLIRGGEEVDRVVGFASYDRLRRMFSRRPAVDDTSATVAASRNSRPAAPGPRQGRSGDEIHSSREPSARKSPTEVAFDATVRLKVVNAGSSSYGSGTIIDVHGREALVLTCGHIFRESKGRGKIFIDLFVDGAKGPTSASLISYDLDRDIGLVSFRPSVPVTPAPVCRLGYRPQSGDRVFSVGCDRGGKPRLEHAKILSVDRFDGPPNLQISGTPVYGRSGGGLFTSRGEVLGVCNGVNKKEKFGLFAGLPIVQRELIRVGQRRLVEPRGDRSGQLAGRSRQSLREDSRDKGPRMPRSFAGAADSRTQRGPESPSPGELSRAELDTLHRLLGKLAGRRGVAVVHAGEEAGGRVMVLPSPSRQLVDRLAEDRTAPGRAPLVARRDEARSPARYGPATKEPVTRGQSP